MNASKKWVVQYMDLSGHALVKNVYQVGDCLYDYPSSDGGVKQTKNT